MTNSTNRQNLFASLIEAITHRDHTTLSQLLIEAPELVNQIGPHPRGIGRSQPLHVAIELDNAFAFKLLLKAGANVDGDSRQYDGWSPVMLTIHWKRAAMLDELIRRGAAIDLIAALMLGDNRRVAKLLRNPTVLLQPVPNAATPLHFARTLKAARLLLARGGNLGTKDKYGKTAPQYWAELQPRSFGLLRLADSLGARPAWDIFKAVEHRQRAEVRQLLRTKEDANARFPAGSRQTLLHSAAWNGDLAMTKLLVSKGADLCARDREHNRTALDWARYALDSFHRKSCKAVAEYLEGLMKTETRQNVTSFREDQSAVCG
jgi:ankyrin repeat protein